MLIISIKNKKKRQLNFDKEKYCCRNCERKHENPNYSTNPWICSCNTCAQGKCPQGDCCKK